MRFFYFLFVAFAVVRKCPTVCQVLRTRGGGATLAPRLCGDRGERCVGGASAAGTERTRISSFLDYVLATWVTR